MFNKFSKFAFICLMTIFSLIVSLVSPSRVLADDGLPPAEPVTEAVSADPPPIEEAEVFQENVVEIIETMDQAGAVLVDENGEPVPLVSEAAHELLTVSDPYIIRSGVTYRFLAIGGCTAFPGDPNCTESSTPIQTAINFSVNGETVFVDPGIYVEQLEINKDIVLQATAPGAIIKSPTLLTDFFVSGVNNNFPIVYVHDTENASIIGFTIDGDGNGDGNYRFDGIGYYNAGGIIQGNTIQNIMNSSFSGTQHGVGIFVYANDGGPHDILIDDNIIEDYQKNGMTISGNGITAEITDNTVTGAGPTSVIAQNGIQVSGGADALIQGNTVTGNVYIPDTVVSTGVLFFGPGDVQIIDNSLDGNDVNAYITGAGTAEINGNTISNGAWNGLWIDDTASATITDNVFLENTEGIGLDNMVNMAGVEISGNAFVDNTLAIANYDTVDVDATGNYWGCPTGPDDPACDQVSDYVIYDPWLVEDPFIPTPLPTVVVPPIVQQKDPVNRFPASSADFIIPVTGGLIEISCDSEALTMLADQTEITFTGLCGYEVAVELLTNELLPGKLDQGDRFLLGLSIHLYKDGISINELPANAKVTISYPLIGTALEWDSVIPAWQESQSNEVKGRTLVDAGSGTYVLIEK
jgi:nitrous oxidase accessory protein NosD